MITWRELVLWNDGVACNFGSFMERADASSVAALRLLANGRVSEWSQFFLSAPDEEPDWDTPRRRVNWRGLKTAVAAARHRK